MAVKIWTGNALATTHQVSLTPGGTIEAGDLFKATINGKTLSVAAPTTAIADLCIAFAAAWAALDSTVYPEFAEILATLDDNTTPTLVYLTANEAGVPFTVTESTTEAGGGAADTQTWTLTTVATATGPHHWDATANWAGGVLPAAGDNVIIDVPAADIRYGIDVDLSLTSMIVRGKVNIGLPRFAASGYANYLDQYLTVTGRIRIDTTGGLVKIDVGAADTAIIEVDQTGEAAESGMPAAQIIGGGAGGCELRRNAGSVGLAVNPGEAAEFQTLAVGGDGNDESNPIRVGPGADITNFYQSGGTVNNYASADFVRVTGGILSILGDVSLAFGEVQHHGGEINWFAPGEITALVCSKPLARKGHQPASIVDATIQHPDAFPVDENGVIAFTNPVVLPPEGVNKINVGTNVLLAVTRS